MAPLTALALALGCAHALPPARPEPAAAAPAAGGSASELLARAEARWAGRPDPAAVGEAEELYLAAARADPRATGGLAGAVKVKAWRAERERDDARRAALAEGAVEAGQWCEARAPASAECAYALAIGLGLQARERRGTALDGLKLMVAKLRQAEAADPRLDRAGPARVLAQVLAQAPGWPLGPGDTDAAVEAARRAVSLFPDHPPNQLALALALQKNDEPGVARAAAERAVALARAARDEPDAAGWIEEGLRLAGGGTDES